MSEGRKASIPISVEAERQLQERRLRKRRSSPEFSAYLTQIRQRISSGTPLTEIRWHLGIKNEKLWSDLLFALSSAYARPENMALEFILKNTSKYNLAAEAYNIAKKDGNYEAMMRAIMIMDKIDNSDFEVKKYLGLLRPIAGVDETGKVIEADLTRAQQEFEKVVEQNITNQLTTARTTFLPISLELLSKLESRTEANPVGQGPLDEINPDRQLPKDNHPQSQSDGCIDVLNLMDNVAVQNKTNP